MAYTVIDVITAALGELGVLGEGEVPTAGQAASGLLALNLFVDTLATKKLFLYTVTRTTKVLTASQASYTVGTGGNIDIARPLFLDNVTLLDTTVTPNTESPLEILTEDRYAAIPQKTLTSTAPQAVYYNPTFPLARLWLFPIPTVALSIALYVPTAVAEYAAISDSVSLPPGWRRMLVKNLALELAPSYERQPSPLLVKQASDSMAAVMRSNERRMDLHFPAEALIGSGAPFYDIRRG